MDAARVPGGGDEGAISRFVATRSAVPSDLADSPSRQIQALWFALGRRNWRSLVLVPADEGGSTVGIATSLAEVGRRLRETPVTFFIMADPIDYASAGNVISAFSARMGGSALAIVPSGKVIVSIQPVIVEPLGLAVTHVADAVILCVEVGRTRLAAARRTIELVGRERIAGCLLVT